MANRYWFARRFPVGHPRNALAPVTPEGHAVVRDFVLWMAGGVVLAVLLLLVGLTVVPFAWVLAPIAFIACAVYAAWKFITTAQGRGDHQHTVDDYKQGRVTAE